MAFIALRLLFSPFMASIKKLLFVALHRPDRSPSQRFRFEQFVPFLESNGWQCDYAALLDEEADRVFYASGSYFSKASMVLKGFKKRLKDLKMANDYDVVFIQRETFIAGTTYFEKQFARSGAKIVYDFDDAIWMLDISDANKKLSFLKDPSKTKKIIALSHLVLAGNQYLADYALKINSQVEIIPTVVNTDYFKTSNPNHSEVVTIGWSGSQTTVKHLLGAQPWLAKIKEKYGDKVRVMAICERDIQMDGVPVEVVAWNRAEEVQALDRIDIGIMPLPDDEWSKGKCGFKGIQYMSMSKPCVMSPVGVNPEIVTDAVNGFLPKTDDDWFTTVCTLIENAELRHRIGAAGRATVEQRYSLNAVKNQLLNALDALVD
jgi:glycosyltransferase involved in cell wall biosynthesis